MSNAYKSIVIALRLWICNSLLFTSAVWVISVVTSQHLFKSLVAICFPVSLMLSLPVFCIQLFTINIIKTNRNGFKNLFTLNLILSLAYSAFIILVINLFGLEHNIEIIQGLIYTTAILFACSSIAIYINLKPLTNYFSHSEHKTKSNFSTTEHFTNQTNTYMETSYPSNSKTTNQGNKVLIKAGVTGALILLMLIPTVFIQNLVEEREQRQKEVVEEVSSKWAGAQVVSGPYIVIPYIETITDGQTITTVKKKHVILLPDDLKINGQVIPENRPRSIYKVLLYRSALNIQGSFKIILPKDIYAANLKLDEAKICIGIKDFKGIEEKLSINFNNTNYDLQPGLPTTEIDSSGLSAPINLTAENFTQPLAFTGNLKLKGSGQLHFMPLSANSSFTLQSTWASPSFNGYGLPADYKISSAGFNATWKFNEANLPFSTFITDGISSKKNLSFGVSMVQPADQYAKTMRSAKYAILIIGLSFALFFIIELMQNKPVHPLQYILVGFALVIFYTLLLSISEFILFDYAYLTAASATVLLITFYVQSHFKSWKVASVFTGILGALYGFIFVLISLEDTALLIGSIGLFIILALIMFVSRKINWYNPSFKTIANETV